MPRTPQTFAELHRQLGEVPLDRIWTRPAPGTATERDVIRVLEAADKRLCELVDGVLVEKAVGTFESVCSGSAAAKVCGHAVDHDLGVVLGPDGAYRLRPGLVRIPSFSFVPWECLPNGEVPDEPLGAFAPALTADVLRRSNTPAEIDRKLADYFASGVKLAWVIDPREQAAKVYTSATKFKELAADGVLDGGRVLPGFKLSLADVFAATKRRKKKPR